MDGAGNQFLACARFSTNQNRGIRRRDLRDLLEDLSKCQTLTDDFFDVAFSTDFVFEIELFLYEFVLELFNFSICPRVFNRYGNLTGNLCEKFNSGIAESSFAKTAEVDNTNRSAPQYHRDRAIRNHAFFNCQ